MRWSVINNIHESIMHLGFDKTLEKVYQFYWFENLSKYVKKFVDNCVTCKISKPHSGKVSSELHPIPKIDIPFHTIHVDITGKLSGKSDCKEYLIVTIDAFSKYILLHHTKYLNSESCIKALKETISLFGVPSRVITDQGRSFSSREYKDFCASQNINLHLIATGGFSFQLNKCSFLKTTVNYLGYTITDGKIRPNSQKILALSKLPPPESITQLRQFIGLASYFRQFVSQFSVIMKPLYHLTSSNTLIWKPEYEIIRKKIISILTSEPVLVIFDAKFPIELHTDASMVGYGAILLHRIDKKPHVIEYYSKTTSVSESKYTSYELETLAIVNAVKHFRHYLLGHHFTIFTDCNSVKASRTKLDLTPRVHRWWSYLQSFNFDIEYREGKRMSHVDFLSRNPIPSHKQNVPTVFEKQVNLVNLSDNWLLAEQQKDTEISEIANKLRNEELETDIAKTYDLRKGVLYRKIQRRGKTICLPMLANNYHNKIIINYKVLILCLLNCSFII